MDRKKRLQTLGVGGIVRPAFAKYDMRYSEIICERIDTTALHQRALAAVRSVLAAEYSRPKDRLHEIASALEMVAVPFTRQWKSGVKNARGYELDKIHLEVICRVSNRSGASFQTSPMDDGLFRATLILHIEPYEELDEPTLDAAFADELAANIADMFEHEMVHYAQTASIQSNDNGVRSRARRANAYPVSDAESAAMTDDIRVRYLSSRNEITAYATNAASELWRALGDQAVSVLSNLASEQAVAASKAVRRYVRLVRPANPLAWQSFQRQVAAKLLDRM